MRDIKFSVMWHDGKSWMDLRYSLDQMCNGEHWDDMSDQPLLRKFSHKETRQYTGIKDINGIEIYEGDIVRQEKNCMFADGKHNKKVVFLFDQFLSGSCSLYSAVVSFDAKVIGNIHQNPELLEGAE